MRRIVLLSHTPKEWSGGVNRWVNDFMTGFPEAVHYSFFDLPENVTRQAGSIVETDRAHTLNTWLKWSGKVTKDDIVIVDGFWGLGLEQFPNVISHSHGIWSHRLPWETDLAPENAFLHAKQVEHRRKHLERGGRLTACSDFIAWSMREQWDFESTVINNGVNLFEWRQAQYRLQRERPLIVHGVNDRSNENKGWSHIELLKRELDADIWSLDEACAEFDMLQRGAVLAQADLVVIPSGHEGNSYFCLEALACNVPIVAYNVGLPFVITHESRTGVVMLRKERSPERTLEGVRTALFFTKDCEFSYQPRQWVSQFSIQNFHKNWREYLTKEFGE